ncbi:MAG: CDP-alcohol phosphatidyltransferase family protein [Candidatus Lokiarchaeota archaeon]|nr:CDP-alcohol phosphatidyltransferase family protein [Candidatus Lokiarchaeota archaeon]
MSSESIPKLLKLKDYITLLGTTIGIIALVCATLGTREFLSLGFFLISITLGTDLVDGYIARKTNTLNEMGKELDSLSDSLTFGIVPAVLTYQSFKTDSFFDIFIIIGAICFAFGALLRLARFNISKSPGYTGVPTPISALMLITFFYTNFFYALARGDINFPFPEISSYLIPLILILIGWFNITTYIHFGEKDKTVYMVFIIVAPLCPIFGIIGISSPNFLVSSVASIFFLGAFFLGLVLIIRGFLMYLFGRSKEKKSS